MNTTNNSSKHPVIAVTGSIAIFRICELIRNLTKSGLSIRVMMTENATRFVGPLTFETLTERKVIVTDWDDGMLHITLKNEASVFVVAPATANIIGKMANGIADDAVSSAYIAMNAPVLVAPAMNPNMYSSPAVTRNLQRLIDDGVEVLDPARGVVVCGDEGRGKMADLPQIETAILRLHEVGKNRPVVRPT
ncbi:MAG: phosphopantothenoylcysteine decarboxylase [Leptonema sp. (in: Bacteria)]|nr:phosphopantothenoylcysteine decarboxylase [Leptonema sp. (in: bacteria)]